MATIKRMRKTTLVLTVAVGLVLVWFIFKSAKAFFSPGMMWDIPSFALTTSYVLILLAILVFALILLRSIKTAETPFALKNVKLLKAIALLLVVLEPCSSFIQWVMGQLHPIDLGGGTVIATSGLQLGGVFLATGLVVYCIALVFEYGISLQQQADETL